MYIYIYIYSPAQLPIRSWCCVKKSDPDPTLRNPIQIPPPQHLERHLGRLEYTYIFFAQPNAKGSGYA